MFHAEDSTAGRAVVVEIPVQKAIHNFRISLNVRVVYLF